MRLSFIVPVYNPISEVFEKCVKSLRDQALKEWEAIFILDGESKVAMDILAKHHDDRFRVHCEIEHCGAQKARNIGGKMATGDFLCFFDSDCILEPGASRMWVEQFDKHPEAAFIYSGYRFFGDKYAIESEQFDPWTLRIRNYISACFPMRREFYPGWTEGIESLQDWDMWLSLLDKAEAAGKDISRLGLFVRGYAFSTALPSAGSISGEGCKPENWPVRMDAVTKRHQLSDREICVSSLSHSHDGKTLAKLIGADFLCVANDKPHHYKTIVQIGFSLGAKSEQHAAIFQEKNIKKILFWTGPDINEMWNSVPLKTIDAMSQLLNKVAKQFCEDKEAQRLLLRAGFRADILPLPIGIPKSIPIPKIRKWLADLSYDFSPVVSVIAKSLPDIDIEVMDGVADLSEYCGLIHLFPDRTLSTTIKRALMTGRHVISNVQQPFCGYINDKDNIENFIESVVTKVRTLSREEVNKEAVKYYKADAKTILEAIA